MIRKILFCVFFSIFLWAFNNSPLQAAEPIETIRVGFYDNKPKIYKDENGQITGLFGDILLYISEKENWKLVFVEGTFSEGLSRLEAGEIDLMVDVAYSDERAMLYDFPSEALYGSWGVVYIKNNAEILSFSDLDQKRVAILGSSVYRYGPESVERYIRAFDLKINFIEVDEYSKIFEMLDRGEVDAAIVSKISGLAAEKMYPNIRDTNIIFSPTELRFALTKGNPKNTLIIERLDYWVRELHDGGSREKYKEILAKHDLSKFVPQIVVVPTWVYYVFAIGTILLLFSWLLLIGFRRASDISLQLLAKKEWYLAKVISNMPIILIILDRDGKIILSEGKGLQSDELKQKYAVGQSWMQLFDNHDDIKTNLYQALQGEESTFNTELGGKVYKTLAYPVVQKNKLVEVALISIDDTEENRLLKAKYNFIKIVQHQLRTPPTVIKWTLELIAPKVLSLLSETEKERWATLYDSNLQMIKLINTISRITEIETGAFPVKLESFSIKDVVENVLNEFSNPIKVKKLTTKIEYNDVKKITMDKIVTKMILQSLISNSVFYSTPNDIIEISIISTSNSWVIKVEDRGIGIPEDLKPLIFAPFTRGADATDYNPSGIGIGLYTAKVLLNNIGGKIWFESNVQEGSTFYAEVPKKIVAKSIK